MPGRKVSKASRSRSPTASGGATGIATWPVPRTICRPSRSTRSTPTPSR